jgi:NADPH:quinone reductase-like Zn-dependent oxidoreductase
VGGEETDRSVDALAVRGRIVQVGVMAGGGMLNVAKLMPKRATVIGTVLRARPIEEKIATTRRFGAEMLPLFESGALRPVIDRRFSFHEIADAHAHMEANANVGKILIDVR